MKTWTKPEIKTLKETELAKTITASACSAYTSTCASARTSFVPPTLY